MIVGVAIIAPDGRVVSLNAPARHHNVIWHMVGDLGYPSPITGEQGFLDDSGRYLDREQAKEEAIRCNQILDGRGNDRELFSEDVWKGCLDVDKPGGAPPVYDGE